MKKAIVGFVLGVAVATGTAAYGRTATLFHLRSGDQALFQGVLCTTSAQVHMVACALNSSYGFSAGVSRQQLIVLNAAGKQVFMRRQP
jgi:hypothetical protein